MYEQKAAFLESIAKRARKPAETRQPETTLSHSPTFEMSLGSSTLEGLVTIPETLDDTNLEQE